MRQANNKRVRGRSSGGRRSPNGANRSYESNGPETKIRGTAMQVYEKYCALARDAGSNSDYVSAENFQQHAEHYYRIMSAAQEQAQQRQQNRQQNGSQPVANEDDGNRGEANREPAPEVDPAEADQPVVDIDVQAS